MNQLKVWMQAATQAEKAALADLAGTSVQMLSQIAGGYRRGGEANVRSGLAIRLEQAAKALNRRNDALPELFRTDLSPECRGCDFAQRCLKDKAALSGFNVMEDVDTP